MLSARNIFFINPMVNKQAPNFMFVLVKIIFLFNPGINSFALNIGPAIS